MSDSQDDVFRAMFFEEARELLAHLHSGLSSLAQASGDRTVLERTYRDAHSLKGAAAMVGYPTIADAARKLEQALLQARTGKAPMTTELARALAIDRDHLAHLIESEERQLRGRLQS